MLTGKKLLFIEYYLGAARFNATKAALLAGYSPKSARSQGSRLLTNVDIQQALRARVSEIAMSADEVLLRLAEHGRGSMESFMDPATGQLDLRKAEASDQLHLIKKLTRTVSDEAVTTTVELYDAQAALVHLGRHHGLFTDKQDVSHSIDGISQEHREYVESLLRQLAGVAASGEPAGTADAPDGGAA